MAGRESYIFNVDAETRQAEQKLENIYKKMNDIDKINQKGKGNFNTVSQRDMTQSMGAIRAVTEEYRGLKQEIDEVYQKLEAASTIRPPRNSSDEYKKQMNEVKQASAEQAREVQKNMQDMERHYQSILTMHRETAEFQQTPTKSHTHVFNTKDLNNYKEAVLAMAKDTDPAIERVDKLKQEMRELKKLDSRTTSDTRRTVSSGYMSFQQARSFESDMHTGITVNEKKRQGNLEQLGSLSTERRKRHEEFKSIEESPTNTDEEIHKKVALQEEIAHHDEEMRLRQEWNKMLSRSVKESESKLQSVQDVNPSVKPERGTAAGMMYERAPSVGLALTSAIGAVFGGLYAKGSSAKGGVRDDVVSIAQRTEQDNSNYNVRKQAEDAGLTDRLGFTAQEMLAFEEIYLSRSGLSGGSQESQIEDLMTASQSQAEFSRVTGVDSEATKDFFGGLFQTGAVSGSQVKDIQEGFIGAIKQSGMEGREKEQLEALQGLVTQNAQGRQISNDDVRHLLGIQSVLASSGNRSLQGEQGGQLLSSLDEGFRNAADDPQLRMLFGQGTEFQGVEGMAHLTERLEGGLANQENLDRMFDIAVGSGRGNESVEAITFQKLAKQMQVDVTMEQSRELLRMGKEGTLDSDNINEFLESNEEIGKVLSEEKLGDYQDMGEATEAQSEAVTDKQASRLNDMGDIIRKVNEKMNGLHPAVYATTVALLALAGAALGAAAAFGIGGLIRGGAAGRLFGKGRGKGPKGGGKTSPILGSDGKPIVSSTPKTKGGGRMGKWMSGIGAILGFGGKGGPKAEGGGGFFSKATQGAKNLFGDGKGPKGGSGLLSKGTGLGKGLLGKALLPIAAMLGINEVIKAEKGEKMSTAGNVAGGIGGWMAGASAGGSVGASAGSVIPGVGTAVGGVLGAVIGGISGSSLGSYIGEGLGKAVGKVGEWVGFGKKVQDTAEITPDHKNGIQGIKTQSSISTSPMSTASYLGVSQDDPDSVTGNKIEGQVERETASQRHQTENIRAENISGEADNLAFYETLLNRAKEILAIARQQNGIFGSAGKGGSGGMEYVAGGGFTSSDLTKHDLAKGDEAMTSQDIDAWINSKAPIDSIMRGMGDAFMQAGQESGLDPRYLVAHAAQETGWGTSNIAKNKGNMYGIGAFDADPYNKAYGYDNTTAGIVEGAKWIKENYYNQGQTTLDSMRNNGGTHEYATDPQWDSKIGNIMKGAPAGSGAVKVDSKIDINIVGNQGVIDSVNSSKELKKVGKRVQDLIYGSMNYHAQERVRA